MSNEKHIGSAAGNPVRVLHGLQGLNELRSAWETVSSQWGGPMLTQAWIRAWADVYGIGPDLDCLVAGEGAALVVAPLVRSRRGGLRYELVGPDSLVESADFLYEGGTHIRELAEALVRSHVPLRFWRIPADSPVLSALTDAYRGHGLLRRQPAEGCPSLPLDPSWMNPEVHLDAKGRQNLRRARRIAEGMGEIATQILAPRPEDVPRIMDEAYAVEAAGWKSRQGSPLVRDPLLGPFFRKYAEAAAATGELRVCFLRIGGRAAAMKLAAVTGNRFWLLAMGFDEEFERCSPGTLLLVETLAYAARSGLRSYEFLGATEAWVRAWGAADRPHVSLRAYPFGVRGAAALAADASDRLRVRARRAKAGVDRIYLNAQRRLALAYSAGPNPDDAVRVAVSLAGLGHRTIVGFMNDDKTDPRTVARNSIAALEGVTANRLDSYVSIKAPALAFNRRLVRGIVDSAHARRVRVHFDALAAADVDPTFSLIEEMQPFHEDLGCTLPGRWKRSTEDAKRAIELGLSVRVIRGEWVDSKEHERDWREGFLEIVDAVAGRVPKVGVATHNPGLARQAVRRLKAARTPCELEVVRGYPIHRVLPVAVSEGIPMRVYIPFGYVAFPYTIGQVVRRPRIVLWVLRDIFRGGTSVVPRDPRGTGGTPPATV